MSFLGFTEARGKRAKEDTGEQKWRSNNQETCSEPCAQRTGIALRYNASDNRSKSFVDELASGVSKNTIFVKGKLVKACLVMEEVPTRAFRYQTSG